MNEARLHAAGQMFNSWDFIAKLGKPIGTLSESRQTPALVPAE
jgi:hypothetical protein